MNVKRVAFTEAECRGIATELKRNQPAHVYKRLMALKFKAIDGMRSDEAGKLLGMYTSSVNRIVNRYKTEGIEAIIGGLPPIVVPKRELGNADFRHENPCYCLAVS